jgi:hypothetical protein
MVEQLPETPFERASQDDRDKERLDRQKVLVSLPEQVSLALLAEKTSEVHAKQEDVLLLLATEDLNTVKARLVQHLRGLGIKMAKIFKVALVAAKEGTAAVKQVFVPAPVYMDLDEEETKRLEKFRKEQEATKKNSAASLYSHR